MASQESILVLGAGELGIAVVRALKAHPSASTTPISILLRPGTGTPTPEKAAQLALLSSLSIPIISADLARDSADHLAALFRPFTTVISCTGFIAGAGTQLKLARSALAAGVRRYFPWQFGVDYDVVGKGSAQDLFDEQLEVRALLRAQERTAWVVVSTGMFMSFLFEEEWGVVDGPGRKVRALGGLGVQVTVTTAEDIAMLTAEVVFLRPEVRNQVVFVAGETVTYGRLAEIVEGIVGGKVQREMWGVEQLEEELLAEPENSLRKYRVVFAKGKGVAWDFEKTFNAQKGIETVGVEQWARKHMRK